MLCSLRMFVLDDRKSLDSKLAFKARRMTAVPSVSLAQYASNAVLASGTPYTVCCSMISLPPSNRIRVMTAFASSPLSMAKPSYEKEGSRRGATALSE